MMTRHTPDDRGGDKGSYPLTPQQLALWLFYQRNPDDPTYNGGFAARVVSEIDVAALRTTFQQILNRHGALRTLFAGEVSEPGQWVQASQEISFEQVDASGLTQEALTERVVASHLRPFDLARGPLFRVCLFTRRKDAHVLLISLHHIIGDAWSLSRLLEELRSMYPALRVGACSQPSGPTVTHSDYEAWLRGTLHSAQGQRMADFWGQHLTGELPALDLGAHLQKAEQTSSDQGYCGASIGFSLSRQQTARLRAFCGEHRLNLQTICLAAYQVLLYRYSGQSGLMTGTAVANRLMPGSAKLVGYLSNFLVVRSLFAPTDTALDALRELDRFLRHAMFSQAYPFPLLDQELRRDHRDQNIELIQASFNFWRPPAELSLFWTPSSAVSSNAPPVDWGGMLLEPFALPRHEALSDIQLEIIDGGEELACAIKYRTNRIPTDLAEQMVEHFQVLLMGIIDNPLHTIAELPLLTGAEQNRLLVEWNDTAADYPQNKCTHQLFEEQVGRTPDAIAVQFEDQRWTYRQLNEHANQLAHHLQEFGIGPDTLVGIHLERSPTLLVAILGILKAGGAYLPLELDLPVQRLEFMMRDSAIECLVTCQTLLDQLPTVDCQTICLDQDRLALTSLSRTNPQTGVAENNLAYVMFTSGSTGQPKGVAICHQSVVNLLTAILPILKIQAGTKLLGVASSGFDISVAEMFLPLIVGGTTIQVSAKNAKDPSHLAKIIDKFQPRIIQATPATWSSLLDAGWTGSKDSDLISTGEALPEADGRRLLDVCRHLWDFYGPTETTIWATIREVTRERISGSIGRPIANTALYVLDAHGEPAPIGVPGELHIAGAGVARGYLNRPRLTAEKFIVNPYTDGSNMRLYRTGDLCRWMSDGTLQLLGRMDHQVKLRGIRIELGEIETVLAAHPTVQQSVVMLREDRPGDKRLVAYCQPVSGAILDFSSLSDHLGQRLPRYMNPAAIIALDVMPLTSSGKIDRHALPAPNPGRINQGDRYVAPRNPLEEQLISIWRDVLNLRQIGIHDNFFDVGGHSLLAARLLSRMRLTFQVQIPFSHIFETPTVASLAEAITHARRTSQREVLPPIEPVPRDHVLPLSFAQQRLWFLDQLGVGAAYNMSFALAATGHLDHKILSATLAAIAGRHEALRTTFPVLAGQPCQQIASTLDLLIDFVDLHHLSPDEARSETHSLALTLLAQPFDLAKGPLLRCMHVRTPDADVILLSIHHSIADGWSMRVLETEFIEHYRALSFGEEPRLPALPIQYADYAIWQRRLFQGEALQPQLTYWLRRLGGDLPTLNLPTDRPRPVDQTFSGASWPLDFPDELSQALRQLNREQGVTMATTLLSVFKLLLARHTGQEDIVVGSPIAGRNLVEIEGLIGFFVNSLVLRTDLSGDPSVEALIQRVHQVTLEAYDHQDLPFERLVDELGTERDLARNPLFQVAFAMQYEQETTQTDAGSDASLSFRRLPIHADLTRMDLELYLFDRGDGIDGQFVYNTDLFDECTIRRMAEHYLRLLREVLANPAQAISRLPMLSEEDRQMLLVDWNSAEKAFSDERCIHQQIENRARETPQAIALVFSARHSDSQLSYGQLNQSANQLAHTLRDLGVEPDTLVGLCLDRGLDMIVGLLGILKAGGAYIPMDASYPSERISYMLNDSGATILLTQSHLLDRFPEYRGRTLCLDKDWPSIARASTRDPEPNAKLHNLAYLIYTSGTTGHPKAALLEHRGLVNLSREQQLAFEVGPHSRVLQFSSPSYDASTFEIMMALPSGATLYLGSREELLPGPDLLNFMRRHAITIATLPPTALAALPVETLPALKTITAAGEACPYDVLVNWAPGRRFFNLYGPTETTIWATTAELTIEDAAIHIGRPIANTRIYILDPGMQPVPVGTPGELYIGGVGVGRGYHRRQDLTSERYLESPFREAERIYRTGDRARYRSDGNIELLGRLDQQVKLHGIRVEPGEIEALLEQHPSVARAVVILREDGRTENKNARLVAYIVSAERPDRGDQRLQADLVSHWKSLYEETYGAVTESLDAEQNFSGWNSSYTDQALPEEEMRQWLEHTVMRIMDAAPERVLEIGCGTGLVLFQVAPRCNRYLGTDFSPAALEYVSGQIERRDRNRPFADVGLARCTATGLDDAISAESFDTLILNSVVQYFPGANYLANALKTALDRVGPVGRIFIGDVRSLPLLRAFHASVQLARAAGDLTPTRLQRRITQFMNQDQELAVDPAFFFAFGRASERVVRVEIMPKRGGYDNELNRFRFDVILHVGVPSPVTEVDVPGPWLDWRNEGMDMTRLAAMLRAQSTDGPPGQLLLSGIPNARTLRHVLLADALACPELPDSIDDIQTAIVTELKQHLPIDPEMLYVLADETGYELALSWAQAHANGAFDAAFYCRSEDPAPGFPGPTRIPGDYISATNNPLHGRRLSRLVPDLRKYLQQSLPEQLVPSAFVVLADLPVLPSGKLDRRALPAPETLRPGLVTTFSLPRSEIEKTLSEIWQRVLGLRQVGVQDNFFELGGDSILSVQVATAAREAGLEISTRHLFEHQSIAALATVAIPSQPDRLALARNPLAGEVPLSAIQHWFFEQAQPQLHHFNQAMLLDVSRPIDSTHLRRVLKALVAHHDALRLRFYHFDGGWSQRVIEQVSPVEVKWFELAAIANLDRPAYIEARSGELQSSLDLSQGPVMRAAVFTGADEPHDRLLLVFHHLIVDGVSWRILLEDLQRGLGQLQRGKPIELPLRTHSVKDHVTQLLAYAETETHEVAVDYWLKQPWEQVKPLPLDSSFEPQQNTVANSDSIVSQLSGESTRQLLREVPGAYSTRIEDALLTALTHTFTRWTDQPWFHIDIEGHGRAAPDHGLDLSRTVGWFTTIHPLLLQTGSDEAPWDPGVALKSVKEQLRVVPNDGIDYGLACHMGSNASLRQALCNQVNAQVSFNYLGQFDESWGPFSRASLAIGPSSAADNRRQYLIEINGAVIENRLRFTWTYNIKCHRQETVRDLAEHFLASLQQLIEYCITSGNGGYTPSDFSMLNVSQDELDEILSELTE